jgi:hypothetical protein
MVVLDVPSPPPFTRDVDKIGDLPIIPQNDLWLLPEEQVSTFGTQKEKASCRPSLGPSLGFLFAPLYFPQAALWSNTQLSPPSPPSMTALQFDSYLKRMERAVGMPAAVYTSALRKCRQHLGGCRIQLKRHLHAGKRYRDGLLADCNRFGISASSATYLVQVRCRDLARVVYTCPITWTARWLPVFCLPSVLYVPNVKVTTGNMPLWLFSSPSPASKVRVFSYFCLGTRQGPRRSEKVACARACA